MEKSAAIALARVHVLLDTNVLIEEIRGVRVLERFSTSWTPVISTITVMELYALPGLSHDEEDRISALIRACIVLPIDETIAMYAGRMKRTRTKRLSLDLLIAATAVTRHLPFYTKNTRDFRDIPGLVSLRP